MYYLIPTHRLYKLKHKFTHLTIYCNNKKKKKKKTIYCMDSLSYLAFPLNYQKIKLPKKENKTRKRERGRKREGLRYRGLRAHFSINRET